MYNLDIEGLCRETSMAGNVGDHWSRVSIEHKTSRMLIANYLSSSSLFLFLYFAQIVIIAKTAF